jgi:hypothetical protein
LFFFFFDFYEISTENSEFVSTHCFVQLVASEANELRNLQLQLELQPWKTGHPVNMYAYNILVFFYGEEMDFFMVGATLLAIGLHAISSFLIGTIFNCVWAELAKLTD